ncbi:MAG TPA: DUF3634 family protein [Gemmataceae bacterium]|nr:DUF3634 family protein [Gemmataceae bacterium]
MTTFQAGLLILGTGALVLAVVLCAAPGLRYSFLLAVRDDKIDIQRGKVTAAFLEEVRRLCQEHGVRRGWLGGVPRARRIRLVFSRSFPPRCQQQLRNVWGVIGWGADQGRQSLQGQKPRVS